MILADDKRHVSFLHHHTFAVIATLRMDWKPKPKPKPGLFAKLYRTGLRWVFWLQSEIIWDDIST